MPTAKQLANLRPLVKGTKRTKEIAAKGGSTKSETKRMVCVLTALSKKKGITEIHLAYLKALKEKDFVEVFASLIGELISNPNCTERTKMLLLDRITRFLPQQIESRNENINRILEPPKIIIPESVKDLFEDEKKKNK